VHRHLHDERGTAYAYSGEIDEWLQNRSRRDSEAATASTPRFLDWRRNQLRHVQALIALTQDTCLHNICP
jgi:hypothetical protein